MAKEYSYSKIGQFNNCPRQYKFQHIERASVEKPVSVELFLGSTVHKTLEKLYTYKINGRIQPRDEMIKDYSASWESTEKNRIKVIREHMGIDDYINVGARALEKYYDIYHPFDEGEILGLEKNIRFPLDPKNRFAIRGKLDRITKRDDGVIEIVDYKTSSKLPTQQNLNDDMQMGLYKIGLQNLWPQFEKIEQKMIFVRQGVAMSAVMNEDKIEEIRYRTYQKILEIEKAIRDDDFPTNESVLCDWCIYHELCPAKRHRLALESDEDVEFDDKRGRELTERYLKINRTKKELETELKALKDEIIKFCKTIDLTRLDSDIGHIKVTLKEEEGFPSKSRDKEAFLDISHMLRQAEMDECFKLDEKTLYKEFFIKEKLPDELMAKLSDYIYKRRADRINTSYKIETGE